MPKSLNTYSLQIWWNCLPAMTSEWHFKEPLRNETKRFLIPKRCFPWLVYTVTPSNSTHYYLISSILPFNTETTKNFSAEKKTTENLRMYTVKNKVHLVNASALISKQKSSFMIRINTGDWSLCGLSTLVISMWNNHRWAEQKQKRRLTMGRSSHKEGDCRSIPAKPTSIKKERTSPDCLKNRRNCINTLEFFISIHIIILQ